MRVLIGRKRSGGVLLRHPLNPVPRTAILAPGFLESRMIRVFPEGWTEETVRFRPTALAAPVSVLCELALRSIVLEHCVIAFTRLEARLSEYDRDFLWTAFGVPVFEQCFGSHQDLLAAECEAHDGLHVVGEWPGDLPAEVEYDVCGCGSGAPRLIERSPAGLTALA